MIPSGSNQPGGRDPRRGREVWIIIYPFFVGKCFALEVPPRFERLSTAQICRFPRMAGFPGHRRELAGLDAVTRPR